MENLIEFLKKYDYMIVFLLLEVLAIVLVSQNSFYQSSRIVHAGNAISGRFHAFGTHVTGYVELHNKNKLLAQENAMLRAKLAESYISYNTKEFTRDDTTYKQQYSYTEATVVKSTWNQQNNYIMINKGSLQGIREDQAVLSPQGMVGVVLSTTKNFATIMPIIHSNSRNSVKIKRININGSLVWNGGNYRYANVIDIPNTTKIYKNDTIVTSGMSNDFPEGVLVGFVEGLYPSKGDGFYNVKVRLATEFTKLDYVYVVKNIYRDEQDTLMSRTMRKEEKDE